MKRSFKQGWLEQAQDRTEGKSNSTRALMLAALSGLALGCGGDGSSGPSTLTGVFVDSPVEGISYSTATQSGVTNANGEFLYRTGETVTFSLGSVELGSASAAAEVNVFDVAGVTTMPTTISEMEDQLWGDPSGQSAFERAINIAVLLQTLDADNNPENGVSIDSDVAALVTPANIDLSLRYYEFRTGGNERDGTGIMKLVRDAAGQGLLSARPVRDSGDALNHALTQAGAVIPYRVATLNTQDNGDDGSIDYRRSSRYSASGRYLGDEVDNNGDGTINQRTDYTWDTSGRQTLYANDTDNDGTADYTTARSYNEFGLLTRMEQVQNGVTTLLQDYIYDDAGRLVESSQTRPTGTLIQYWRVDANGMRSTYEIDEDADGTIDVREQLTYDGQSRGDRWTYRETDRGVDGSIDRTWRRAFNAGGSLILDERDNDADGTVDYRYVAEYSNGVLTMADVSNSGPGSNYIQRWTRDANGNALEYSYDNGRDGVLDQIVIYTRDASGNVTEQTSDNDGDGTPEYRYTYTYNADGFQVEATEDRGADGSIERRTVYTVDNEGQRLSWTVDDGDDGTIDRRHENGEWIDIGAGRYI